MAAPRVLHLFFLTFAFGLAVGLAGCPRTPAATNVGTAAPDTEAGETVDAAFDMVAPEETADVLGSSDLAQPADVEPDADTGCGLDVWWYLGLPPAESGENYCKVTVTLGLPCDFEGEWVPHECSSIGFSPAASDPGCACTGSPTGDLVCVRAGCWDGCTCPPGWHCMVTFFETTLCVDYGTLVPEPCGIPCYMPGLDCVQLGGAGRFCLEYASRTLRTGLSQRLRLTVEAGWQPSRRA